MLLILAFQLAFLPYLGKADLSSSKVSIQNSGYTGLVIAIHPDVEESDELIDAIKDSWTEASRDLFVATGNRAFFKEITILVPKAWKNNAYNAARGSENFDQADVVISPANSTYGNEPYTVQHDGCGKPGIRTHFTPVYFLDDAYVENYGRRGKVIVHEWAHYRWGVFDETSETEPFYWDPLYGPDNGPVTTTCPRDLVGDIINVNSETYTRCSLYDLDKTTETYPDYCVFFPREDQYYDIDTSMMAYQYLEEVVTFCKDSNDQTSNDHNFHNIYAPTPQNRLCSMRSTWSVIKESTDYSKWNVGEDTTDTDPVFEIVQPQVATQRFVLILDDSGSMADRDCGDTTRTECLKSAAYQFISVSAPTGSFVGIVDFGTTARITNYLTELGTTQDREYLAKSLESLDASSGGTCIGCGILYGIEVLEHGGNQAAGGHLVVITDGEENQHPSVSSVRSEVLSKGVIIETMFISTDSNAILKDLTTDSGGTYFLANSRSDMYQIFNQISITDSTSAGNSYQIESATFSVDASTSFRSSVLIDATIGTSTTFTFTWSIGNQPPNIYLNSPSGCHFSNYVVSGSLCPNGDSSHAVNVAFSTIKFEIPGVAEVGEWNYVVDKQSSVGDITSIVTSETASEAVQPIITESGMSQTEIEEGDAAIVFAKVTQGDSPILGAKVIATVSGPGLAVDIDLYDNGGGCDIKKSDGIYSRYFTQFSGAGRYAVDVRVSNNATVDGTNRKKREAGSRANYRPGVISADGAVSVNPNGAVPRKGDGSSGGIQSEDLGLFSRISQAGSFDYTGTYDITSPVPAANTFSPGKITDLRMWQNDIEDYKQGVVIQFTATGDDFDQGKAAGYDIRYTFNDPTSLITDFDSNDAIIDSNVIKGDLGNPASAGVLEELILETPHLPVDLNEKVVNNSRLSLSIRAFDSDSNYGSPSNVAVINFFIAPYIFPTVTTSTEKVITAITAKSPAPCKECAACDPQTKYKWIAAGLGITTALLLPTTCILALWLHSSNKERKTKDDFQMSIAKNKVGPSSAWEA